MGSQLIGSFGFWNLFEQYLPSSFTYCYHLGNVISLGLAQSDPIKQRLLYNNICVITLLKKKHLFQKKI